MVRFCNSCKKAVDDLDKFCRSCGHSTSDSIDYHTYYRLSIKDENDPLLWFMKGADMALRQEIEEVNEKVDIIYQKLFPPSVGELRKEFDRIFDKKEEHKEEKPIDKPLEIVHEKKEEHKEETLAEKFPEKEDEHKEEKSVDKLPGKEEERVEDNIIGLNIGNPGHINTTEVIENKDLDEKLLIESSEEKEDWPLQEEGTGEEISKKQGEIEVPEEVNDKLGMLLQEDEGQRQAVQYLINKYNKNKGKKVGDTVNNKSDDKPSVNISTGPSIAIVPQEDVVRIGRARGKGKEKGEPYKMYDVAVHPFIPDILKSIESSNDGMIRVRLLDIAKKMGEKFVDKKPVTIYGGLKYTLFDHNIVVEMGSLKDADPVTKESVKILKMRMRNPDDTLPPSLLERRGEIE